MRVVIVDPDLKAGRKLAASVEKMLPSADVLLYGESQEALTGIETHSPDVTFVAASTSTACRPRVPGQARNKTTTITKYVGIVDKPDADASIAWISAGATMVVARPVDSLGIRTALRGVAGGIEFADPTVLTRLPRSRRPSSGVLAVIATALLAAIVVSGAAVRLTSSGLGCPTWPRCTDTSLVAPPSYRALVEFINRVVSFAVVARRRRVAVAALLRRPRRRDLSLLAWSLVAGFVAQASSADSPSSTARARLGDGALPAVHGAAVRRSGPGAPRRCRLASHGRAGAQRAARSHDSSRRRPPPSCWCWAPIRPAPAARRRQHQAGAALRPSARPRDTLHADSALLLTGLVIATLFAVRLTDTTTVVRRRAAWLAAAVVVQVVIGYVQYFLNLPPSVVGMHVAGATALWCAAVWLALATYSRSGAARAEVVDGDVVHFDDRPLAGQH